MGGDWRSSNLRRLSMHRNLPSGLRDQVEQKIKVQEAVMPDQGNGINVNIPISPERAKDICVMAGLLLEGLNYFAPHLPPTVCGFSGLFLRALINSFSGGKA